MPYITIYLGHMFGHQISNPWGTVPDPLWLRTINIPRQWAAMHSFSAFLPWVIFPLWIGSLPLLLARASDVRGRSVAFLQWLLGSWLLTLSVGLSGDFYGHHFIFAVPAYCGFFFVCVRERSPPLQSLIGQWGTGMWVALLSLGLLLAPVPSLTIDPGWEQWMTERRSAAATIDAVLDRCGVERYLLLINANDGIHAFTRHSPHGPLFTQYAHFIAGRLAFLEAFGRQFHTAPIVIDKDDEPRPLIDEESLHEFQTAFTEKPPACAGEGFMQPVPYRILFRIGEQT